MDTEEEEVQYPYYYRLVDADIYLRGTDWADRDDNEVSYLLPFRKAHLAEASAFFRNMFADATADEQTIRRFPCIDVPEGATWELYTIFAICADDTAANASPGLARMARDDIGLIVNCWKAACFYEVEQAQSQVEYVLSK